ncbi:MAG: hypothetical protein GC162_16210 [Planctomycetes bacterium]|nr:hypothetical protein [Planctomycetota bacterium]
MKKFIFTAVAMCLIIAMSASAHAAIIYVDANSGAGGNTVRDSNGSTTDWVGATNATNDNLWFNRTASAGMFGEGDVWETLPEGENAPQLRTTVTGLINGNYDVYVYFGTPNTSSTLWQIRAGLTNSGLVQYSSASPDATKLFDDTSFDGWRVKIGTATVTGGTLSVFIAHMTDSAPTGERTYYDGIGYEQIITVPTPGALPAGLGLLSFAAMRRKRRD